jgi:hypothetical protein
MVKARVRFSGMTATLSPHNIPWQWDMSHQVRRVEGGLSVIMDQLASPVGLKKLQGYFWS